MITSINVEFHSQKNLYLFLLTSKGCNQVVNYVNKENLGQLGRF